MVCEGFCRNHKTPYIIDIGCCECGCAWCPGAVDWQNCGTVLGALECGWGLIFMIILTLYITLGNEGSSNVVL